MRQQRQVSHVGHCHPRVVAAGKQQALYSLAAGWILSHRDHDYPFWNAVLKATQQLQTLNTNTRYLHDNIVHYVRELLATLPPPLSVIVLVNSGSEANELALRMAKAKSGGTSTIVLGSGYHGNTDQLVGLRCSCRHALC